MKNDVDITFIGSSSFDQEMKEADSELESMPDDEVMSISGNEDEKDDSDKELSVADEIEADKVIDTLNSIANKKGIDTTIFAASDPTVSSMSTSSSVPITSQGGCSSTNCKSYMGEKEHPSKNDSSCLITWLSLPDKFANKMDSLVPRMLVDAFEERMHELLFDTLKNILPQLLNDSFNSLNKLESQRFVTLEKKLRKSILCQASDEADQLHRTDPSLIYKVPRDILVVNAKHLQTKLDRTSNDIHELVELVTQLVRTIDSVAPPSNDDTKGEKESQAHPDPAMEVPTSTQGKQQSSDTFISQIVAGEGAMTLKEAKLQMQEVKRLADLKAKKEKSEKKLRKVMTPKQLRAQAEELAAIEAKRVKMMDEYNHYINFRDGPLPITNFSCKIRKSTNIASMKVTRNKQPLNYNIFNNFKFKKLGFKELLELHDLASNKKNASNDLLLRNLKAKFQWVATIAGKLGIPPPS
ncbi:hypothetical protein Tco_1055583 [Tanacetum coccineum]|uniref:Uncharacterized protein n=1 Tax=Tanacetum coccineum TaxID=301880 RepID=A0ABQ5H035_9ASTR